MLSTYARIQRDPSSDPARRQVHCPPQISWVAPLHGILCLLRGASELISLLRSPDIYIGCGGDSNIRTNSTIIGLVIFGNLKTGEEVLSHLVNLYESSDCTGYLLSANDETYPSIWCDLSPLYLCHSLLELFREWRFF